MDRDEAEVKLIPSENEDKCHQKSSFQWRVWRLLTVFIIFGVITVWIVFTIYPSLEARTKELLNERLEVKDTWINAKGNCSTLPNATREWKLHIGFKEIVPGTLIYSAYFDNTRQTPYIRIIAISETFRPPKIFCHSICERNKIQEAKFQLVSGHKNRRHAAFIISCELPSGVGRVPNFVSLSAYYDKKRSQIFTFPVISTAKKRHLSEYTVCVPPLYGNVIAPVNFIEFIEMSRILGATKFVFYNQNIPKELAKIVNIYQRKGVVMVMPWKLPHYLDDFYAIHYHGQLASIQDCLYRNRGKSKWVAFNDLDEFLVPVKQPTITSLLNTISRHDASGYCIRMVLLPKNNVFTAEDQTNKTLITQQYVFRTTTVFRRKKRSKCIVDPEKVLEMGIHYINEPVYGNYMETWVSPKEALVFHYRNCIKFDDLKEACHSLKPEGFMLKYKKRLTARVNSVLHMGTNLTSTS